MSSSSPQLLSGKNDAALTRAWGVWRACVVGARLAELAMLKHHTSHRVWWRSGLSSSRFGGMYLGSRSDKKPESWLQRHRSGGGTGGGGAAGGTRVRIVNLDETKTRIPVVLEDSKDDGDDEALAIDFRDVWFTPQTSTGIAEYFCPDEIYSAEVAPTAPKSTGDTEYLCREDVVLVLCDSQTETGQVFCSDSQTETSQVFCSDSQIETSQLFCDYQTETSLPEATMAEAAAAAEHEQKRAAAVKLAAKVWDPSSLMTRHIRIPSFDQIIR